MAAAPSSFRRGAHRRAPSTTSATTRSTRRVCRQHRELLRRRPGADRRSPDRFASTASTPGRVLRPAGHDGGHAGRQLQPRHAAAHRERRSQDRRSSRTRCSARRCSCSTTPSQAATSAVGSMSTSTRSRRRPSRPPASAGSLDIGQYQVGPLRYLRFNYTTGDAAGPEHDRQGDARRLRPGSRRTTRAARVHALGQRRHRQEALAHQHAADTGQARGGRGRDQERCCSRASWGSRGDELFCARQISNVGAFLGGNANNGAHYANGLTAMFIATGQDVANISESHAGVTYSQLLDNGDYYWSVTLTSLIVATHGGGTGLPTQRECLEMLGCYGTGKVESSPRSARPSSWPARRRSAAPCSTATGYRATTVSAATRRERGQ